MQKGDTTMQKGDKASDDFQYFNFFDELVCDVYLCVVRYFVTLQNLNP